jgi:hypothetical protein
MTAVRLSLRHLVLDYGFISLTGMQSSAAGGNDSRARRCEYSPLWPRRIAAEPNRRAKILNIILLLIILIILFGGGGFYYGGPYVGGGLGTILFIVLIIS